ncbi:hypothetical protein [Nonomuraea sp. NPDC049784]|uniref:hypothetical protein n=1 Tax=Nonomuraea sp. NPDC049784 TaxID=3154361 RepID=UPI003410DDB4
MSFLQLYNHLVEKAEFRQCANELCDKTFVRQRGRAEFGQHRTSGILYHSRDCARAQAQRQLRRRRKADQAQLLTAPGRNQTTLIVILTLPVLPVATYAASSLPSTVPDTANEVGWPAFVSTVEGVVAALPADERARAVILTNDYSEASPLVLLGSGLPPVYSGHNAYWEWGPPPARRTVVVHVGDRRPTDWSRFLRRLPRRGPDRQRAGHPERGAGQGRLGLHRSAGVVDHDVARTPDHQLVR